MNNAIAAKIANILAIIAAGNLADLVDLNDWAVNTVRDFADAMGYNPAAIVADEAAFIDANGLDLAAYTRAVRVSHRRLSRPVRRAIWTVVATRRAIESLG